MTGPSEPTEPAPPVEHVDLLGLLRGDLSTDEALDVGDHLRSCAACRDELVDTAVGHAVLVRAVQGSTVPPTAPRTRRPCPRSRSPSAGPPVGRGGSWRSRRPRRSSRRREASPPSGWPTTPPPRAPSRSPRWSR